MKCHLTKRQVTQALRDFRALLKDTRGTEIAEAAAVLPIMFMILLGIFWFGQAFSIYGAITRAAQEGARAGSIPYCVTCSGASTTAQQEANASTAVQAALVASRLDPSKARYPVPPPILLQCGGGAAPACSVGGNPHICIQAPVQLTDPPPGATGICGMSVSLQYPFQFWLPFTSLNKQTVWIAASSRVRMENW
jgi:TadE-like protein